MRHSYFGKKLSRTKNERRRLLQGLARDLINHGSITTTVAKAKAVQPLVERLVTNAKKGTNAGVNEVRKVLANKKSVDQLLGDAKTRFSERTSGFTRITKLGTMRSDASSMAKLSFVDARVEAQVIPPKAIEKEKQLAKEPKSKGKSPDKVVKTTKKRSTVKK